MNTQAPETATQRAERTAAKYAALAKATADCLAALEPFDGRAYGRINESDRDTMRRAIEAANAADPDADDFASLVTPQNVQRRNKTGTGSVMDLTGLREKAERYGTLARTCATVGGLPETAEYLKALQGLRDASDKLDNALKARGFRLNDARSALSVA